MTKSGVIVDEEVKTILQKLKKDDQYLYAVFTLATVENTPVWQVKSTYPKMKEICNKKQIPPNEFKPYYDEFVKKEFLIDEPMFAVFDCGGLKSAGRNLVGYQWCPDECSVKKKMVFASSVDEIKKLVNTERVIKTNDYDEVTFEAVTRL